MKHLFAILRPVALAVALLGGTFAACADDDELPAIIPGQPPINGIALYHILNDAQKGEYRAALEANHDKMLGLQKQIMTARKALVDVQIAEKFDEAAFRAHAEEILRAQTEMEVLNALAFAKVRPSLTPEQVERLKTSPPLNRPHGGPEARPGVFPMGAPAIPQARRWETNASPATVSPPHP